MTTQIQYEGVLQIEGKIHNTIQLEGYIKRSGNDFYSEKTNILDVFFSDLRNYLIYGFYDYMCCNICAKEKIKEDINEYNAYMYSSEYHFNQFLESKEYLYFDYTVDKQYIDIYINTINYCAKKHNIEIKFCVNNNEINIDAGLRLYFL